MAVKLSTTTTNNSANNARSRYVQGGTTDRFARRLGWWERRVLVQDDTDLTVIVRPEEDRRPDIIAYNLYGYAHLAWVVLQFNNIVDIQTELKTGAELRLPTPRRLTLDIMNRSPR